MAGIDLTCNGMVKRARSNSLYLVSNDFEMRPGTCEGATFVLNVERDIEREGGGANDDLGEGFEGGGLSRFP